MSGVVPGLWAAAASAASPALRFWLRLRQHRARRSPAGWPNGAGTSATRARPAACCGCMPPAWGRQCRSFRCWRALEARAPSLTLLVTTGTVTSAELLTRRVGQQGRVLHRFVPLDVPAWTRRFLDHWRPDAAAFVESELWPNLLDACRRRHIPLMLVNARLSARSHARWVRLPGFARHVLAASP